MRNGGFVFAGIAALVLVPSTAAAQYLDPGSGSVLLQELIALVGASAISVGVYWRAVKNLVRSIFRSTKTPTSSHPDGH